MGRFVNNDAIDAAVAVADAAEALHSHYVQFMAKLDEEHGKVHLWWNKQMQDLYSAFVISVCNYIKVRRGV